MRVMNLKDATQEILEGRFFAPCPACEGKGCLLNNDEPIVVGSLIRQFNALGQYAAIKECPYCRSHGRLVREEYLLACKVTNTPFPSPPVWDQIGLKRIGRVKNIEKTRVDLGWVIIRDPFEAFESSTGNQNVQIIEEQRHLLVR